MENDEGIKQLNYVKLSSVLSLCVREQQQKIEWLESSGYELIEDVKELKGKKKPKAKTKAKSKEWKIIYSIIIWEIIL